MKKSLLPRVEFDLVPIDLETELLYAFSDPSDRFSNVIHKVYPELKDILGKSKNKEETIRNFQKFILDIIERDKAEILRAKDLIFNDWVQVSDSFLKILSEHLETNWPKDKKVITGYISINPVCPRFLAKYSFFVNYRMNVERARETIAHEILHFLWFKKWKEVFPNSKDAEYESPNLIWRLSEIMDPILLQCHPDMKKLIKPMRWGYRSFESLKIGNIGMTEYFANLYMENVRQGKKFDEILKILWTEAQGNEEVLSRF